MSRESLTPTEMNRYARHLVLPNFGLEAQMRLKQSSVLVIGAGGLGSPILLYLAAAGVGCLGIVDFDRVDLSNLQRQVLYDETDIGAWKAERAAQKLQQLNSDIQVKPHCTRLSRENALELFAPYDLIIDGSDNFPTRYLANDAAVLAGKPYVYGAIYRFEGQVAVFNALRSDGSRGPNYRDLHPTPPPPELVPNCQEGGVLGVLPGIIGSMQAMEAIKLLAGLPCALDGRLFLYDALEWRTMTIEIPKNPAVKIAELVDYEIFCGLTPAIAALSPHDLKARLQANEPLQLIDVRENHERVKGHIGGLHIPLAALPDQLERIDPSHTVVVYCQSGKRSERALQIIANNIQVPRLYHLAGGIAAWELENTVTAS
ncbi:MAG TPA: molybdopterin-synthase adenylyltransferase MoeB [Saprospiraceae bacterium]|nr:molybdopterin-synthase adenylyltransferase MoeB [Saprospiraceae bacterium]HMQ83008.1 molybdopterin-synthase adenylyltransferase MoeB [Saprospiraceae bacterium]